MSGFVDQEGGDREEEEIVVAKNLYINNKSQEPCVGSWLLSAKLVTLPFVSIGSRLQHK